MLHSRAKKYTIDELKVGMRVTTSQLSEIYGHYIILSDVKLVQDDMGVCKFEGIVDSITDVQIPFKNENSTLVYHDPMDKDCCYEY